MKTMNFVGKEKNSRICSILLLGGTVIFTGCSLNLKHHEKKYNNNSNIAYAVPEKVALDGVDVRKKPTRPLWTEDTLDENLNVENSRLKSIKKQYIVKKGDTLYSIARKFKVPVKDLMNLNGMDNTAKLYIGQKIQIPASSSIVEESHSKGKTRNIATYTVKTGDSLFKIARAHNMTLFEIRELNDSVSDKIYVGQHLKVYETNTSKNSIKENNDVKKRIFTEDSDGYYTVQAGDTLGAIAKGFNVSVVQLKEFNNIKDSSKLQIGRKLIIHNKNSALKNNTLVDSSIESEDILSKEFPSWKTATENDNQQVPLIEKVEKKDLSDDFFENFDEIPVVEINN